MKKIKFRLRKAYERKKNSGIIKTGLMGYFAKTMAFGQLLSKWLKVLIII